MWPFTHILTRFWLSSRSVDPQPGPVTTTRTTWPPAGTGPPSCWWGTRSTAPPWTSGPSGVFLPNSCREFLCGPGSPTWISCTWSGRLLVRGRRFHVSVFRLICWVNQTHPSALWRWPDSSAPAGVQHQPVLLRTPHPRTAGAGEPPIRTVVQKPPFTRIYPLGAFQEPLEQKYPNLSQQTLSLMKVRRSITRTHRTWGSAGSCELNPLLLLRAAWRWTRPSGWAVSSSSSTRTSAAWERGARARRRNRTGPETRGPASPAGPSPPGWEPPMKMFRFVQ